MKKTLFIKTFILWTLISVSVFGDNFPKSADVIPLPPGRDADIIVEGDDVYFHKYFASSSTLPVITKEVKFFMDGKYLRMKHGEHDYVVIPGDDLYQSFAEPSREDLTERYPEFYGVWSDNSVDFKPSDINIKGISTKSSFSQKLYGRTIKHKPAWLGRKFFRGCSCHDFNFDELVPPWIENFEDFGSKEEITIMFNRPSDGIVVLNGYVDIFRTHLFEQFNRMKKIKIVADEFSMTVDFKDEIKFSSIRFPKSTKSVKINILSAYSGTRNEATAISAILGYIPKKQTKAEIMERLSKQKSFR